MERVDERGSKVRIFCYTGTGNSLRVARWFAEFTGENGGVGELRLLEKGTVCERLSPDESIALVFPTHGFTAPWTVIRFVLSLPRSHATAVCIVTHDGSFGNALLVVGTLLRLKGYSLGGLFDSRMPQNWFQFNPTGVHPAQDAMKQAARSRLWVQLEQELSGKVSLLSWAEIRKHAYGMALLPISVIYLFWGRFFFAKSMFANDRCRGCGACVRGCPANAIRMTKTFKSRPYWTFSCEGCARCAAVCPEKAVEFGHSWLLLMLLTASGLTEWVVDSWSPFSGAWVVQAIARIAGILISAWVCYWVFHHLTKISFVNSLFAFLTGTHYWGRYRDSDGLMGDILSVRKKAPPNERSR